MDSATPHHDELDQAIEAKAAALAEKESVADKLAREVELERAELRALRHAATLRPLRTNGSARTGGYSPPTDDRPQKSGKGKPAGTLSQQWRQVMGQAVE